MTVFHFAVVRYVPEPIRGEFVNVGVILASSSPPFFGSKFLNKSHTRRLKAISGRTSFPFLFDFVEEVKASHRTFQEAFERSNPEWSLDELSRAVDEWATTLQFSALRPVQGENPERLLHRLFAEYVSDKSPETRGYRDRRWIKGRISRGVKAFVEDHAGMTLSDRVFSKDVRVDGQSGINRFDFGLKNGRFEHLIDTQSFELPDRSTIDTEITTAAWMSFDTRREMPNIPITVAAIGDTKAPTAFSAAERTFKSINVTLVPESRLDELINELGRKAIRLMGDRDSN